MVDDEGQSVLDILTDSDYMNYDDDDIASTPDVYINGEEADEDTTIYVATSWRPLRMMTALSPTWWSAATPWPLWTASTPT